MVELASVDRTGEPNWLYGREDIAGDGLDEFGPAEQAIDVRTTYLVAADGDLWLRAYVSSTEAPGEGVRLFVFVDNDRDDDTGGSAVAPEIDERFTTDPTTGGYEYVVGLRGDETIEGVWRWSAANEEYEPLSIDDVDAVAEAGVDFDPLWINGGDHGYLQLQAPLAELGLDGTCNADFFVRAVSDDEDLGDGDLDVGRRVRCLGGNAGGGRVPPAAIPPEECTRDGECAGGGLCIDGGCFIPRGCRADADCAGDEACSDQGYCVFDESSETCDEDDECGDLVCSAASECVGCTDDDACGDGRRCASTGRCVDASDVASGTGGSGTGGSGAAPSSGGAASDPTSLAEGEKIQGGAFTCTFTPSLGLSSLAWSAWLLPCAAWAARRSRRKGDPS